MKTIVRELQTRKRGIHYLPRWSLTTTNVHCPVSVKYMATDGPKDPTPNDDVLSMGRGGEED